MSTTDPCTNLILIGMAGTGKTTLGKMAAGALSWCHIDTDYLLQSWWGMSLQALRDRLGLEAFLQAEADMLTRLKVCRCVISTG
ncbi:MAG: shikimate kinase, partial [Desulfonatronovibrionaceae bacterium]